MNDKYNTKISQLSGLFTQTVTEIIGDSTLKQGEKFLIVQQLIAGITPATKQFDKVKKQIEEFAKAELSDNGTGVSDEFDYEGSTLLVKYAYPKPSLDGEKLATELERAYAELNTAFDIQMYQKETTPRKTVIIQSKLNN